MTEKTMGSIKDVVIETASGLVEARLMSKEVYDEIVACFNEDPDGLVRCPHCSLLSAVSCNACGGTVSSLYPEKGITDDGHGHTCCRDMIAPKQPPYVDVEERERGPGRVEVYVHSDLHTKNKGCAMVLVTSQTDFAARTQMFIAFAKKCAKMFYASSHLHENPTWEDVVGIFPDLIEEKAALETELREKIAVVDSAILTI